MHTVISNYKKKTEQNGYFSQQSTFSHGKLKSTNNWLPITMSAKSSPSWWPQEWNSEAEVPTAELQHVLHVPGLIFTW